MINLNNLKNKKVGVLGLEKTGLSVVNAVKQAGGSLICWDDDKEKRDNLESIGISVRDLNSKKLIRDLDLLVVSPGIPHLYPKPHPIVTLAYELNIRVDNDIGLFFSNHIQEEYETISNPPKIIAITGSNGKSTVTALVAHVLSKVFKDVEMGGNIGKPVLELSPVKEGSIRILELSSYQIELAKCLAPNFAAFINFSSDHLQRHGGLGGYFYAKARLFLENYSWKLFWDTNNGKLALGNNCWKPFLQNNIFPHTRAKGVNIILLEPTYIFQKMFLNPEANITPILTRTKLL